MTVATTRGSIRKEYPLINRGDGRIEICCPHGVGHVSAKLSKKMYPTRWDAGWMLVHGCDGCCDKAVFYIAELAHLEKMDA